MPTTPDAVADLDIKASHDRLPHDVFLKLRLCAVVNDLPAAVGTLLRQRNCNLLIHTIRNRPKRPIPIVGAALASGPLRIGLGFAVRSRLVPSSTVLAGIGSL